MAKKRMTVFSVVKAVKENARERVGTPPPATPIPDRKYKAEHGKQKHKRPPGEFPDDEETLRGTGGPG